MRTLARLGVLLAIVQLTACGQGHSRKSELQPRLKAPPFSETVLAAYRKDAMGGFSTHWVAYLLEPKEGAADKSTYVEVNGTRMGPYAQVSGRMEVSRGGKHIAFAAQKGDKWVVVVDGVEKYTHDGLLWPWSAWSPSLEGNSYIPQTQAADLEFSPNGESLAYPAKTPDGKYAVFVNGKPGPSYPDIGASLSFVGDRPVYFAIPEDKKIVEVVGGQLLGPYDESYTTKVSADGKHFVFWAKKASQAALVVDGQERDLPGEVSDYVIGNGGFLAYSYKSSGKYHVHVGNADLPDAYDEVSNMTLSPDNKNVAFWAQHDGKWLLATADKTFPGFGGYFLYQSGSTKYCIMWTPDSQHLAYYVRDNDGTLVLDGEKLQGKFSPSGIALQVIVDDQGRPVGTGLMNGPQVDATAVAQAIVLRDKTKCDPFSVALIGATLSCVEKKPDGSYMQIGDKAEGPFRNIHSTLYKSAQDRHYAYVVETDKGQHFMVDGALSPHIYEAIYRLEFNEENGSIEYLALKEGKLMRVVEPLQVK
ncbi:MAG TPA: hypothetical protein VJR23_03430 [Candidatus Acidoferrales bacterium]|nr:hypothetical protein [Candidatus Acidoferrales bacterium]